MMKFRGVANLIKDGHPTQIFSNDERAITKWAEQIHAKEKVQVEVFISEERRILCLIPSMLEPAAVKSPLKKQCFYNHDSLRETSNLESCPDCNERIVRG